MANKLGPKKKRLLPAKGSPAGVDRLAENLRQGVSRSVLLMPINEPQASKPKTPRALAATSTTEREKTDALARAVGVKICRFANAGCSCHDKRYKQLCAGVTKNAAEIIAMVGR